MSEFARPTADSAYINWGNASGAPVDLWAELDEPVPEGSSFIQTIVAAPVSEHYVARLSTVPDPGTDAGHVARIQARKQTPGGERIDLAVEVRQGYLDEALPGMLIAEFFADDLPESSAVVEYALPSELASRITDYSDLFARVVANQPRIVLKNSALRSLSGQGCGSGDREALRYSFGATPATKLLDETGDTWNRAESARTIKTGTWQAVLFYDSTLGQGPTNKIRVQVLALNPDCSLKQSVMDQTVSVLKGQSGATVLAQQAASAIVLAAGDILALTISKASGNQAVTLRYNGAAHQQSMSKLVDPGEDIVNSKAEVSWFELETP